MLYYIFILHQTTTASPYTSSTMSCIISSFYIKPQLQVNNKTLDKGCIISSFYIKPQLENFIFTLNKSCIISSFYIKPQLIE